MGWVKGQASGWRAWLCVAAVAALLSAGGAEPEEEEWVLVNPAGLVEKTVVRSMQQSWYDFSSDFDPRPSDNAFFDVAQERADADGPPLVLDMSDVPTVYIERTTKWHYQSPQHWVAVAQRAQTDLTIDLTGYPTNKYRAAKIVWEIPFYVHDFKYLRKPRSRRTHAFAANYVNDLLVPGVTNYISGVTMDPEVWTSLSDWAVPKWEGIEGYSYAIADAGIKLFVQPGVPPPSNPNPDRWKAEEGDPINTITGNVSVDETDILIPCPGFPLRFARAYSSQLGWSERMGARWTHSYASKLTSVSQTADGKTYQWCLLHTPRGGRLAFTKREDGSFASPKGSQLTLAYTNGSYRLTAPNGTLIRFDSDGVWRTMTDSWGNRVSLAYEGGYPNHKLTRVQHSYGLSLDFSYTNGMLAKVSSQDDALSVAFTYDAGELRKATRFLPGEDLVTTYAYDQNSQHVLTQRVNAAGMTYVWDYDRHSNGRLSTVGSGSVVGDGYFDTSIAVDLPQLIWMSVTDPTYFKGRYYGWPWMSRDPDPLPIGGEAGEGGGEDIGCACSADDYERWQGVTRVTRRRGEEPIEYEYGVSWPHRLVLGIRGPNPTTNWQEEGKGTLYDYDRNSNVSEVRRIDHATGVCLHTARNHDTHGNVTNAGVGFCGSPLYYTHYEWDTDGDAHTLASITDPEGARTEFAYTNGSVSRTTVYDGTNGTYETTFGYNGVGLLAATRNANGVETSYVYDEYGHLVSAVPEVGVAPRMEYNRLGHVTRVISPGDIPRETVFESNPLGRVLHIVHANGSEERFQYDGIGNVTSHVDRAGRTTTFAYGPARTLTRVSRVLAGETNRAVTVRHHFDKQLNTVGISDALERPVESYRLDLEDRPDRVTNVESQEMSVAYYLGDFVSSVTRFDGTVVSNRYTRSGLLGEVHYPDDTNTFGYLKNGLMRTARNAEGIVSNTYSEANRLVSTTGSVSGRAVRYTYYPAGQASNVTSVAGTTAYVLDKGDRLHQLRAPSGTYAYNYDASDGNLDAVEFPNGIRVSYDYDVMDRLDGITWRGADDSVIRSFSYRYNRADLITNATFETGEQVDYRYDSLDRLTSETSLSAKGKATSERTYDYDLVGNRLATVADGERTSYTFPYGVEGNRLQGWNTTAEEAEPPTYFIFFGDSKGVPGSRGRRGSPGDDTAGSGDYGHDAAGCVTNIAREGSALQLRWDGRYRLKSIGRGGALLAANGYDALGRWAWAERDGVKTCFVYDGPHVVAEVDAAGAPIRTYTWGPGVDNLLAMTDHATTNTYHFIIDHLGTTHAAVDVTGAIVESYQYDAWGQVLGVYDADGTPLAESKIGNHYLWQGRWYNWDAKLYNFRTRWYDPQTGRWLSKDPIGIAGGLNQYVFCGNDPVNERDPFGFYQSDTLNPAVQFVHEINPFNQHGSFNNQVAAGWLGLMGHWDLAGDLSGRGQLEDADAGKGWKRAYWAGIGTCAAGCAGAFTANLFNAGAASTFFASGNSGYQAALAGKGSGVLISETIGGKILVAANVKSRVVWKVASAIFAANATGQVQVFLSNPTAKSVWLTIERPILSLMKNAEIVYR